MPNSNRNLPSEDYSLLTPDSKELCRKLPSDMKSITLKGRNPKTSSNVNSHNRLNESNSNKYKPVVPLSYKSEPSTKGNLHEFRSDSLVENNEHEDSDSGIEDAIEFNDSESTSLVKSTSSNKINPATVTKGESI